MPSPFPGMDPYLEHPDLWPGVHNALMAALQLQLAPKVRPHYVVRIEERTYLAEHDEMVFVGRPDIVVAGRPAAVDAGPGREETSAIAVKVPVPDRIRETYLEVRRVADGEVVTLFELLSPANKRPGKGRRRYERKRLVVLGTLTHLVEVDLIRVGEPMTVYGAAGASDYTILISRGDRRPRADLLRFGVRDPIPTFRLPLRGGDEEPDVDIGGVLHDLYDRAGYDLSVDYAAESVPPLREEDRAWARERFGR